MNLRLTLFVLCTIIIAVPAAGQGLPEQLIEEIESVPAGNTGVWELGGRSYTANGQTLVADQYPATIGNLAVVEFFVRDGDAVATRILPLPLKVAEISDGPYVSWKDESTAEVVTFQDGKVRREMIRGLDAPREIQSAPEAGSSIVLDPQPPTPPAAKWESPDRLLAISDLEGNYRNALRFLQNNEVLDQEGHWNWGDGHLVLIGDLVDRGPMVTELMWLVRRMEREAAAVGGQVHYVLGNHEAMVMAGDLRYVHPKYHFVASRIGTPYDELFGVDSDTGRWWRSRNGVVQVGDLLFVHGGYSPELDRADLDLDTLNQRIRDGLHPTQPTGNSPAVNPVGHLHGPFWYRGYFHQHAAQWGGQATVPEIERILDRHEARHIVIGHTLVQHVGPLDKTGLVIATDVAWADPGRGEGLLQENGKLWRLTMTGQREEILAGVKN